MDQNYKSSKLPTAASQTPSPAGAAWLNPSRITANDGSSSTLGFFAGGDHGAVITGSVFAIQKLPASAVIDGIQLNIVGSNTGCYGTVSLNISGSTGKDVGALNGGYGGKTDKWGKTTITPTDIANLTASVDLGDVSGGDGIASIDYMQVTVFWHIEVTGLAADVPTRFDYKVYSRAGRYLGLLPNVTTKFAFPQDMNSAGVSFQVTCSKYVDNEVTVDPLLTEAGDPILTESNLPILATVTNMLIAPGAATDEAIFKNSNRVKVWMYNQYYPNGKLMFSGQMKRVKFKYGGGDATVSMTLYSDGFDLNNYIARGYPFSYTTDVDNYVGGASKIVSVAGGKGAGWDLFGQTWKTGASVSNIAAIRLGLNGSADVTVAVYDAVNGNLLAYATKTVSTYWADIVFEFLSLIPVTPNTTYFFAVSVGDGQSIEIACSPGDTYANGSMYESIYSGGSGGGSYGPIVGDLGFTTYAGAPTTTTTYSSQDPITGTAHGVLLDYNGRGGTITEGSFDAAGYNLTLKFVVAFILDVINKVIEAAPAGTYYYVDAGASKIDIKKASTTADYTVVRGRHIEELEIDMSIENVKNYLLLTGGDTGAGVNLFKQYGDAASQGNFDLNTATKTDNRMTLTSTADAVGASFIAENAKEQQYTTLTVLNSQMDITKLTPGKTIGFRNFGNFIDDLVLQIVRREPNFSDGYVVLSLGMQPPRLSDEIQRINRDLLNEQTIDNPTAPS